MATVLHGSQLGTRTGLDHGSFAGTGQTHSQCLPAHDWSDRCAQLCKLSPDPQSRTLEPTLRCKATAGCCDRTPRARWACRHWYGRYYRAPMGTQDHCTRHLPGSCTLKSWSLRQGQRAALVELHDPCASAVGEVGQGSTSSDLARPFRAIQSSTWASSQTPDRLGKARCTATLPLAARAAGNLCWRQQFCRTRTGPCYYPARRSDQPVTARCEPLCLT